MGDDGEYYQLARDDVFHSVERRADSLLATHFGLANHLPADIVSKMFKNALNVSQGEGDVEIPELEFLGVTATMGTDGQPGHVSTLERIVGSAKLA